MFLLSVWFSVSDKVMYVGVGFLVPWGLDSSCFLLLARWHACVVLRCSSGIVPSDSYVKLHVGWSCDIFFSFLKDNLLQCKFPGFSYL